MVATVLEKPVRSEALRDTVSRLAIYWAQWNQWTLNDPERFMQSGNYAEIDFIQAIKQNEITDRGDVTPPIGGC